MTVKELTAGSETKRRDDMREWYNGIEYDFEKEKDGWISVYEIHWNTRKRIPVIQARDIEHARSYCVMRERVNVQLDVIA